MRSGERIDGNEGDDIAGIFCEIFVDRCYTPRWFYRPNADDVVVDIGANIGIFSTFISIAEPKVQIHAFEPHPETFARLSKNIGQNQLNNVSLHELAIARQRGSMYFAADSSKDSGHQNCISSGLGLAAKSITLTDAIDLRNSKTISLLKIDTEGAEAEIVEGATIETWQRVQRVVIEFHSLENRDVILARLRTLYPNCMVVPQPGFEHHLGLIFASRVVTNRCFAPG